MNDVRVLLVTLSCRTSSKGRTYLSGYLGKCRVVGFPGQPDRYGNETFDAFVSPAPDPVPVRAPSAPRELATEDRVEPGGGWVPGTGLPPGCAWGCAPHPRNGPMHLRSALLVALVTLAGCLSPAQREAVNQDYMRKLMAAPVQRHSPLVEESLAAWDRRLAARDARQQQRTLDAILRELRD